MVSAAVCWLLIASAQPALPPSADVLKEIRSLQSEGYRGEADKGRMKWEAAVRASPADPMPRVYLAWLTLPSDDAWNQLKAVASQNPDNPWAHYGMGLVYVRWKMRDQAAQEFDTPLKKDPNFYPAMIGQGQLLLSQGKLPEAEERFRAALKLASDAEAHAGLGLALVKEGKKDDALPELKQAIAGWPDQPEVLDALLSIALESKQTAVALETANHLADLRPRDKSVHQRLADLYDASGDKAKAATEYDKVLKLGDPSLELVKKLEAYRRESNDPDEQRLLELHANLDRNDPAPNLRLAELALAKGNDDAAKKQLDAAVLRNPKLAHPHLMLAAIHEKKGVIYRQLEELRLAAKADPADPGNDATELATAKEKAAALEKDLKLAKPFKGSVDNINWGVSKSLGDFFTERKKATPSIGGTLKLRVKVKATGEIDAIEVTEDSVGDAYVTAHAYFSLLQAGFPKQKREPQFEFDLKKGK